MRGFGRLRPKRRAFEPAVAGL